MSNATYEVIIRNPADGKIWELTPKSYDFTEKLNQESVANFNLSFEEIKQMAERNDTTVIDIFTASLREIYINRNGTKIFYGVVSEFTVTPGGVGEKDVSIKAIGFFGLFRKRLVGKGTEVKYTATDAGAIAWDLISDSQASDSPYSTWGITMGSITTSKNRDRGYLFDYISDAIIALSNDNLKDGFDFDIDTTKAFNVYYPTKGQARPTVVFDERTALGWNYRKLLFSEMVNKVWVVGEGFNDATNFELRTAGIGYRSPFGTLEEKLDARNTTEDATLQDKGDRRLLEGQDTIIKLDGVNHYDNPSFISFTDYNLGDTVIVNLPDLGISSLSKRVIERVFTMKSPSSIGEISLKLKTV